jgi:MinD-like ATPase involved in chromosome partitioning or flagellar assembly
MASEEGVRNPVRLTVALGNSERERRLVPGLIETGEITIAARCLAADQLLETLRAGGTDVALVALDLHRLNSSALEALRATGMPVVALEGGGGVQLPEPWAIVLPASAQPDEIRSAVAAASRGERPARREVAEPVTDIASPVEQLPAVSGVVAVVGGKGSPGCTTVAANLAAAWGAVEPTVLVDLDLRGPNVAALLGLDPTRNLFMVAHADPKNAREWNRALEQECQPLAPRSTHGLALAGIPKQAMRSAITISFLQRLLTELQARHRYVVLDVGCLPSSGEASVATWLAATAGQLLFVTTATVTGVWNAKTALANAPELHRDGTALVINQHDRRVHHSREEIEWALERPSAAIIPFDHCAMAVASSAQKPIIFGRHSRAGRALIEFAERAHGGHIILPPESKPARRRGRKLSVAPVWERLRRAPAMLRRPAAPVVASVEIAEEAI